jgi:hypothetical protein
MAMFAMMIGSLSGLVAFGGAAGVMAYASTRLGR